MGILKKVPKQDENHIRKFARKFDDISAAGTDLSTHQLYIMYGIILQHSIYFTFLPAHLL